MDKRNELYIEGLGKVPTLPPEPLPVDVDMTPKTQIALAQYLKYVLDNRIERTGEDRMTGLTSVVHFVREILTADEGWDFLVTAIKGLSPLPDRFEGPILEELADIGQHKLYTVFDRIYEWTITNRIAWL